MTSEAASAGLLIEGVDKAFGPVPVLHGVGLEVRPGELMTLLGPSGSGKTTLLKVVAGFELPDAGQVRLQGRDITSIPPARRDIGMVFQNYALFPHLSVRGNVAFPLEMRRRPGAELRQRVDAALDLVNLLALGDRMPRQLSGGQQQRVALARAVVFEPLLLLLDEPFGALDRKLREAMQLEVRALQRRLGITTVFITHDQEEALILSDRIAVMNAGRIEQVGTPTEVYERPGTAFVADFIGESNLYPATVLDGGKGVRLDNGLELAAEAAGPAGARVGVMIRPEWLAQGQTGGMGTGGGTVLRGVVEDLVYIGVSWKCRLRLAEGPELLVRVPAGRSAALPAVGEAFAVTLSPRDLHVLKLDAA